MVQKKSNRTDQEWLVLIKECRSSGLSDKDWCDLNGISRSSFYYHLRKLRKQACEIPEALSSGKIPLRQEVVPVQIQDDNAISLLPTDPAPQLSGPGNSPAICIRFRNVEIEILNNADSDVIRNTLTAVGSLCQAISPGYRDYIWSPAYTDMRKSIDGLMTIIRDTYDMDPYTNALFLFCGRRADRIKALYFDKTGFVLLYKRLESGRFQWPRSSSEVRPLTRQEYRWLLEGLSIEQPKALQPSRGRKDY